jgi:hypothetical protein
MSKYVFRTDLRQQLVGEPLPCIEASELFIFPESPTCNECVHMLLAADEICLGLSEKREVMNGARLVGYIQIVDAC